MTGILSWRKLLALLTIDALLVLATSSAWAAGTGARLSVSGPMLPTLLVAVGLVGLPLLRRDPG